MALVAVKDPEVLAKLEGGQKPVTDPAILSQLEGDGGTAANLAKIDQQSANDNFEEPETFAYLFNRLKKGFAGFMGLPGDVVRLVQEASRPYGGNTKAANARFAEVTRDQEPYEPPKVMATSEQYRDVAGYEPMKTHSDLKRYAGGVAEMAGGGGPFGLSMKAANLPALATSIGGSGIGMEAGGDIASGLGMNREVGEAAGALLGGAATAITPNALRATGSILKNRFSQSAQKARGESAAAAEIGGQLESYPPAAGNIERSLQISDEIPGFTPSLPARAGAPGLLAEEKRLVSQNPKTLNKAVQNIEENNKAIEAYVEDKFPLGGPETAQQRVQKLAKTHVDRLEGMKTAIDQKLDDSVRVFEANPSNYENGNRLRDLFFKQKEVYSGIRSQKYQEVYDAADRVGAKANIDDVVKYVDDSLKSEMNAYQQSEIPSVFRQVKSDFIKESKSGPTIKKTPTGKEIKHYDVGPVEQEAADVSFKELHSLYKRTNADLASLRGSTAQDKDFKIRLLEGMKDRLTEKIAGFEQAGFGEVADKLREANRFYATEYLPRFKQGFGGDVAAKYPTGEFRTPDQLVTNMITGKPNNTQAAKDFKLLFDEVPEAWQSLRNGYLDELYRGSVIDKGGHINQRALDTFLRKHEPTLAEFPQIRSELKGLSADNQALLDRRAQITATEKKLAAKDLYKLFLGRDPDVILTEATTNPNAMRVLAHQARNDKDMAQGLARGIAERATAQPDPMAFLAANEDAIRIGLKPLGEEHFKNLQTAVEAMTINARNPAPASINAGSIVPDSLAANLGSSPRAIISAVQSIERGRTGPLQEGASFLGRWYDKLRRDHKAAAMEAVFYDKDAARALANLAKNPKGEKTQMDFAQQMTSLGVRAELAGQQ